MSGLLTSRRSFLQGVGLLLAAPAIVKASSLMPVRAVDPQTDILALLERQLAQCEMTIRDNLTAIIYGDGPPGWSAGLATLIPPEDADYSWHEVRARQYVTLTPDSWRNL